MSLKLTAQQMLYDSPVWMNIFQPESEYNADEIHFCLALILVIYEFFYHQFFLIFELLLET